MNTQSEEQRMAALERANNVRLAKKLAKQKLRSGELTLAEALLRTPPSVREMRMEECLLAVPGIGPQKVRRILLHAGISPSVKLRHLPRAGREKVLDATHAMCPVIGSQFDG